MIKGLPSDGILKLSEAAVDGYTVTIKINGGTTIEGNECSINLADYNASNIEIVVTNYKYLPIDTGVLLDSLPYIAILGVVIIGGGIFFINKRKKENDV